jgi:hypothetical protein
MSAKFNKFDEEFAIAQLEKIVSDHNQRCHAYVESITQNEKPFDYLMAMKDLSSFFHSSLERMHYLGQLYCDINSHGYIGFSPIGSIYHEKTDSLLCYSASFSDDVLNLSTELNHKNIPAPAPKAEQEQLQPEPEPVFPVWYKPSNKPSDNITLMLHVSDREETFLFGYHESGNYYMADGTHIPDNSVVDWTYFPSTNFLQSV